MRERSSHTSQRQVLLGVDLGGTKLSAAVVGLDGMMQVERTVETDPVGGRAVVQQIGALTRSMIGTAGSAHDLAFCQLGSPGVLDETSGAIRLAPNIPDFDQIDVVGMLKRELGCPVGVENDVAAAMFGEYCSGSARGSRNAVFVSLGTGIGCGILADGRILRGANGGAGEIAYMPIGYDPSRRESHVTGALEMAVGSAALRAEYARLTGGDGRLTLREIFLRMAAGDLHAADVIDRAADRIASAIYTLVAVLDPECVVLGGSIGVQSAMAERLRLRLEAISHRPVDIRTSSLGTRAGLIGAVAMGLANLGLNPQLVRP